MTTKIKYPTHPAYWADRQLLCETVLLKTITVLNTLVPTSEAYMMRDILNTYETGLKELLEHHENKVTK